MVAQVEEAEGSLLCPILPELPWATAQSVSGSLRVHMGLQTLHVVHLEV